MNPVEKYFTAERFWCALGMGLGVLAIAVAAYCFIKLKQPFYSGMAYSLLVLGVFFLVVCVGVFFRSPKDITRVNQYLESKSQMLSNEELPRMDKVMRNFRFIMITEGVVIAASLLVLVFSKAGSSWKGAALGTLILAMLLLAFDYLATKRGAEYHQFLIQKVNNAE